MVDTNPRGTERLHEYWVHGEGAAKIRWGQPGDFDRCVLHLGKFIKDPQGYCNLAHKAALGFYPATHAAMEHKAGRAAMSTTPSYDPDGLDESWEGDHADLPDMTGMGVSHMEAAEKAMGMTPPSAGKSMSRLAKVGTGARFAKLKAALASKGASDPGALAAWIGRRKYGKQAFSKLAAKARGGGSASRAQFLRFYPLEDIHIVRSSEDAGTDGRVVEAYAAVFGDPAEIKDAEGHYLEIVERTAFNRRLEHVKRSRAGIGQIKCLYNHGKTIWGTPSERFSMPIGTPVDITAESRGLLTRTKYNKTPLADEVLENIRTGAITSQSFVGDIVRSEPRPSRYGGYQPDSAGNLVTVRRTELGLRDYGPVVFPAYTGAEILGVRMSLPGERFPEEESYYQDDGTPPSEGPAAGDPLTSTLLREADGHSARYHQHALFRMKLEELREKKGLTW